MLALLRHHAHRVGPWPRRILALAFLALAAVSALDAGDGTRPPSRAPMVTVVVAGRDLPVGHVLVGSDLRARAWPATVAPPGAAARTAVLLGRRLAGPVARGEPLTPRRLVGRDLTSGLAAGEVAAAVPLDDPHVGDLVHAGDRVDVLAVARPDTSDTGSGPRAAGRPAAPSTVVDDAVVLAVFDDMDAGADDGGSEVVLATTPDVVTRLASAASSDVFTIVGRAP